MPARKSYQQYTVVKGDTLAAIAKRFGTDVATIAVTSGIADPNKITVGQVLSIPLAQDDLSEVKVTAQLRPTSSPKADPRAALADTSAGSAGGIASWFQPPRLWFTLGVLATLGYAILGGRRKK